MHHVLSLQKGDRVPQRKRRAIRSAEHSASLGDGMEFPDYSGGGGSGVAAAAAAAASAAAVGGGDHFHSPSSFDSLKLDHDLVYNSDDINEHTSVVVPYVNPERALISAPPPSLDTQSGSSGGAMPEAPAPAAAAAAAHASLQYAPVSCVMTPDKAEHKSQLMVQEYDDDSTTTTTKNGERNGHSTSTNSNNALYQGIDEEGSADPDALFLPMDSADDDLFNSLLTDFEFHQIS